MSKIAKGVAAIKAIDIATDLVDGIDLGKKRRKNTALLPIVLVVLIGALSWHWWQGRKEAEFAARQQATPAGRVGAIEDRMRAT